MATLTYESTFSGRESSELAPRDKRAKRAQEERMVVVPVADDSDTATGEYAVCTASGTYTVNIATSDRCGCADVETNGADKCVHERRAALAITNDDVPAPGDTVGAHPAESQRNALRAEISAVESKLEQAGQRSITRLTRLHSRKDKLSKVIDRVRTLTV